MPDSALYRMRRSLPTYRPARHPPAQRRTSRVRVRLIRSRNLRAKARPLTLRSQNGPHVRRTVDNFGNGAERCLQRRHFERVARRHFRSLHLWHHTTDCRAGVRRELRLCHAAPGTVHAARQPLQVDGLSVHRGRRFRWTVRLQSWLRASGALCRLPAGCDIRREGARMCRAHCPPLHALPGFPRITLQTLRLTARYSLRTLEF
jgi:hypothetical protein